MLFQTHSEKIKEAMSGAPDSDTRKRLKPNRRQTQVSFSPELFGVAFGEIPTGVNLEHRFGALIHIIDH
jgi:hypothetical protein